MRAGTVFTTHTPVPAGIDRFPKALIERYFAGFGVPLHELLALGAEEDPTKFNMAHMGLRLGQRANGVSELHGHVSRGMFSDLWPGFDEGDVPIGSITNGVHAPTWTARELVEMGTQTSSQGDPVDGRRRRCTSTASTRSRPPTCGASAARCAAGWSRRCAAGSATPRCRAAPPRPRSAGPTTAFDPDVLTIGFARRVPSYKRLTLMLRDPERLKALLLDPERPIQLIIAGKSHPADDGGKQLIQQMVPFADDPEIRHRIAFLPGYDIGMARYLYWGCDVWLNNPLRPLEACGTSGMKAALNGGLNLSIRDGWWDEWFDGQNGWAIPTADGVDGPRPPRRGRGAGHLRPARQPGRCRGSTSATRDGVPARWVEMVRHTLRETGPKVLATRMVRDYVAGSCTCRPPAPRARMAGDGYAPGPRGGGLAVAPAAATGTRAGGATSRRPAAATPRRSARRWTCAPRSSCRGWRRATSRCRPPTAGWTTPTGCTR